MVHLVNHLNSNFLHFFRHSFFRIFYLCIRNKLKNDMRVLSLQDSKAQLVSSPPISKLHCSDFPMNLLTDFPAPCRSSHPPAYQHSDLLSAIHRTVYFIITSGTWMGEYVIQCWTLISGIELENPPSELLSKSPTYTQNEAFSGRPFPFSVIIYRKRNGLCLSKKILFLAYFLVENAPPTKFQNVWEKNPTSLQLLPTIT